MRVVERPAPRYEQLDNIAVVHSVKQPVANVRGKQLRDNQQSVVTAQTNVRCVINMSRDFLRATFGIRAKSLTQLQNLIVILNVMCNFMLDDDIMQPNVYP